MTAGKSRKAARVQVSKKAKLGVSLLRLQRPRVHSLYGPQNAAVLWRIDVFLYFEFFLITSVLFISSSFTHLIFFFFIFHKKKL